MLYKNNPVHQKVLEENQLVHRVESQFYDAMHPEIHNSDEHAELQRDLEIISGKLKEKSVVDMLDVGCGTGNITLHFLQDRRVRITALDISEEMLDCLIKKIPSEYRIIAIHSSVEEYLDRTSERFDFISINSVLHHLYDPYEVFAVLCERLKPGGVLFAAHEPLHRHQRKAALGVRLITFFDRLFFRLGRLCGRTHWPKIDHRWSDYQREGIDLERLKTILAASSFDFQCALSSVFRTRFAAAMNRRWPKATNSFRLIAQKQQRATNSDG